MVDVVGGVNLVRRSGKLTWFVKNGQISGMLLARSTGFLFDGIEIEIHSYRLIWLDVNP